MTIIEQIKAEIERLKKVAHLNQLEYFKIGNSVLADSYSGGEAMACEILSFLSTLESEKPMNQDEELNEEIKRFAAEYDYERSEDILLITTVARHFYDLGCTRTAEKYDEIEYNRQRAEESVPNDLEEAAIQYATHKKKSDEKEMETELPMGAYYLAKDSFTAGAKWQENKGHETIRLAEDHAFLAGADWQKEQMLKEAVEGEIFDDYDKDICEHHLTILTTVPPGYNDGDKVRIIIVKE